MKQYGDGYTGNAGVQYWLICDGSTYGGEDAVRRGFISDASWTRQVQTGGGYWEYRYQDTGKPAIGGGLNLGSLTMHITASLLSA